MFLPTSSSVVIVCLCVFDFASVSALRTAPSKEACYTCSCGKFYEDAAGTVEIEDITKWGIIPKPDVETPATGAGADQDSPQNGDISRKNNMKGGGGAICHRLSGDITGCGCQAAGKYFNKNSDYFQLFQISNELCMNKFMRRCFFKLTKG